MPAARAARSRTQPVVTSRAAHLHVRETRTQTPFELASGIASAGYSDSPQLNVNLPVANAAGQLALTLINLGSGNLINLELSALEADNRGKVVSSPRVITADNQKAAIEQGTEIPYVTPGSANSPATVAFKKAVLRLDVTPQITPDDRIIMTVEVRKDSVGQFVQLGGGFSVPSIDTKNVITQIPVNNGDTAVIGGIYEEDDPQRRHQVPFLGDVPILGYLFKQTGTSSNKTELLIFLTPRIVKDYGQRGAVNPTDRRRPRRHPSLMPRCRCTGAISSWSACWARASPRSGASSRGGCDKRFVDADHELEQRLGVHDSDDLRDRGRGGLSRPRGGDARRAHRARPTSCSPPAAARCCGRRTARA